MEGSSEGQLKILRPFDSSRKATDYQFLASGKEALQCKMLTDVLGSCCRFVLTAIVCWPVGEYTPSVGKLL